MPPKAAYRAFDAEPELEFEFFLADRLGRTVEELRESMTQDEFVRWSVFHGRKAQRAELARKAGR
ncbi:hypothetical protein ACH4T9_19970 [Micromonospora sp. NPDC020750]|uniref:hypothetical protein n=1 Tax=unclassified Micromonospora TaxID=2617518 RepID=UPI00379573F0